MAAHRKRKQRHVSGRTLRAAVTLALAGAAAAAALDEPAQAAPASPAEVRARVASLYHDAEAATERYNGAKEKADKAEARLDDLRDEAARRTDRVNSLRDDLGSTAAAQYREGTLAPYVRLALSPDPDRYLERTSLAERAGRGQAGKLRSLAREQAAVDGLRSEAKKQTSTLRKRQGELKRRKKTIGGKLTEARELLSRLTARERNRVGRGRGADAPAAEGVPAAAREGGAPAAGSSRASAAVAYAYRAVGSPYVWGASGPHAYDCSGLTQAAYRAAGVALPRTTYAQINAGHRVPRSQLAPGDLVFYYSGVSHVGIYVGGGRVIHAPSPGSTVSFAPVDSMPFAGAARVA
ncbi:NlpC/P60 family protein [Streptomyces sp. NPDC050560]|uniref:C40 family peptidase n=1 Tax=Streptomyces sp. NPDC050560 TaxID=3365630 RepID=UPI0037A425BE